MLKHTIIFSCSLMFLVNPKGISQVNIDSMIVQRDLLMNVFFDNNNSPEKRLIARKELNKIQDIIAEKELGARQKKWESNYNFLIEELEKSNKSRKKIIDDLFVILETQSYPILIREKALIRLLEVNDDKVYDEIFKNFTKYQYWHSESDGEDDIYFAYFPILRFIEKNRDFKYVTPILESLNNLYTKENIHSTYVVYMFGELLRIIIDDQKLFETILSSFIENSKETNPVLSKNLEKIQERY